MELTHIPVVSDLEQAKHFYRDILGADERQAPGKLCPSG
jgi:catechol 2,3-dioxygenase-like lactoylglutathione lyase family enzyme